MRDLEALRREDQHVRVEPNDALITLEICARREQATEITQDRTSTAHLLSELGWERVKELIPEQRVVPTARRRETADALEAPLEPGRSRAIGERLKEDRISG